MAEEKVYLTSQALENFKKELQDLIETRRPKTVERVAETHVPGELEENSDYIQAKENLSFIDGRISELEGIIAKTVLIDEGHVNCQAVDLGCLITVKTGGEEKIFQLVGEWEADPENKKISHESPLGQALFGKKIGEQIEVDAPAGKIIYTIIKIE